MIQPSSHSADPDAIEPIFAEPERAAKVAADVAGEAVEAALARSRPDVLWALAGVSGPEGGEGGAPGAR